ncbi:N-acetylglucosamine kinase [Brassicibacter mesophilus]|uniref:N-acetylglucosamine kinase n=1 Tax=Brassicibacter mesophilus TaxID=745119 RepID=UPI003D19254C
MKYYVGIDGGGSKTFACISDGHNMISSVEVGATNYHSVGIESVQVELERIFLYLLKELHIQKDDIRSLCLGCAGIDCTKDEQTIYNLFRKIGYKNRLQVCNDSIIALVAANGKKTGGLIISGTGSIAVGVDENGQVYRVGGWGHILDDIGSGYFIGKRAIQAIMKYYDGRGSKTILWDEIKEKLKITSPEDLIPYTYDNKLSKQMISSLAESVINVSKFDGVARNIIDEAVKGLTDMAITLISKIDKYDIPLGLYGSILLKSEIIREELCKQINNHYPDIIIKIPTISAAEGALILAMEGDACQ